MSDKPPRYDEVFEEGVKWLDGEGFIEMDPTQPPPYYKATHRANGIEPNAEHIDWVVATRGREAAITFLRIEIEKKALRLGAKGLDKELEDLFKIEQATAKLRQLLQLEQVMGEGDE